MQKVSFTYNPEAPFCLELGAERERRGHLVKSEREVFLYWIAYPITGLPTVLTLVEREIKISSKVKSFSLMNNIGSDPRVTAYIYREG